jgi:serine/threonine-protein phosphatase 2A regulatory subunit B'
LLKAISQFVKKDDTLAEIAILACLKYWPVMDPQKEIGFLTEIDLILNTVKQVQNVVDVRECVFTRISKCMSSQHYAVAERALQLLHNPTLRFILGAFAESEPWLMTFLVDAICKNTVNQPKMSKPNLSSLRMLAPNNSFHWRESVRGMSFFAAKKVLSEVNNRLYETLVSEYRERELIKAKTLRGREEAWRIIEAKLH